MAPTNASGGSPLRALVDMQNASCKFRNRIKRRLRRFTMRRMSGARNDRHIDGTIAFFSGNLDLADCPILVVGALQDCNGHANVGEIFRNIPAAKCWVEPRSVPPVEGVVDVAVPAFQLGPEIGG